MSNEDPIDRDLLDELRKKRGNISLVSRQNGVGFDYLKSLFDRDTPVGSTFQVSNEPFPKDVKTLGKPGMERFVVAAKRRGCVWPLIYKDALDSARRKYDAGTHEMVQGHTRGFVVQYLVPRRRPVEPRRHFRGLHLV